MYNKKISIYKYLNKEFRYTTDELAVEDQLLIEIAGWPYARIMYTPGDETNLALGFCFSQGLISSPADILSMQHLSREKKISIDLQKNILERLRQERDSLCTHVGSSGETSFGPNLAAEAPLNSVSAENHLEVETLFAMQKDFQSRMQIFPRTGGTHSACIFSLDNQMLGFAEDIGRHNAMDKVIGQVLNADNQNRAFIGLLSSRISREMALKATRFGLQILAGVSASTSMAVDLAQEHNLTLIGFFRQERFNIYTHAHRIG